MLEQARLPDAAREEALVALFHVDALLVTAAATFSTEGNLTMGAVEDFLLVGVRWTGIGDCIFFSHCRHLHQLQFSGQLFDYVDFVVVFQLLACPTMRTRARLSGGLLVESADALRAKNLAAF